MAILFIIFQFLIEIISGIFTGKNYKDNISNLKEQLIKESIKIEKECKQAGLLLENEKLTKSEREIAIKN